MVSEGAALSMAACNVRQAAPGAWQLFELFPAGSTNQSVACADDARPRRAERATRIRQTWRMPNLLPTGPMMPRLVASPRLPRQRNTASRIPHLPAAAGPQVPIPAYVQPCSPAQSIVNPTKLSARVKEAWYPDGATRRRVGAVTDRRRIEGQQRCWTPRVRRIVATRRQWGGSPRARPARARVAASAPRRAARGHCAPGPPRCGQDGDHTHQRLGGTRQSANVWHARAANGTHRRDAGDCPCSVREQPPTHANSNQERRPRRGILGGYRRVLVAVTPSG